jgi:hypothetical protein
VEHDLPCGKYGVRHDIGNAHNPQPRMRIPQSAAAARLSGYISSAPRNERVADPADGQRSGDESKRQGGTKLGEKGPHKALYRIVIQPVSDLLAGAGSA